MMLMIDEILLLIGLDTRKADTVKKKNVNVDLIISIRYLRPNRDCVSVKLFPRRFSIFSKAIFLDYFGVFKLNLISYICACDSFHFEKLFGH